MRRSEKRLAHDAKKAAERDAARIAAVQEELETCLKDLPVLLENLKNKNWEWLHREMREEQADEMYGYIMIHGSEEQKDYWDNRRETNWY